MLLLGASNSRMSGCKQHLETMWGTDVAFSKGGDAPGDS
jgi:hypothetical protein